MALTREKTHPEWVASEMLIPLYLAAYDLYMAGEWKLDGMSPTAQAAYWEDLRDALHLPEGYATERGVNNG